MSEEVIYAHLKFPESRKTENIQELDRFEIKAPPVSSHVWRQIALTLTFLCLLLLIGLGPLGSIWHKCKPCPNHWLWYKNNCYLFSETRQTWQDSATSCSSQNASLLQIKEKSTLEFVKSQKLYYYWLGLSPRQDDKNSGENIISSARLKRYMNDINKMFCGYIYATNIFYVPCTERHLLACEKKANPVKAESVLMSEDPDREM
ncbi:C-type lectin domain family 12 member A isoform X3 [Fukomys damarensis]|uniref:C-type lectin domain family 12 member A isoform X3 n=1 Tax=Fukomys damarensis TaxID=885580 RepID=UPI00054013CF|nr:C-type lectin domain family 12 member A isoform X3 [Fukomys damarensis]